VVNALQIGLVGLNTIELGISPEEQAQGLGVVPRGDPEKESEVDRHSSEKLCPGNAPILRIESQGPNQGALQSVVGIVAGKIPCLDPSLVALNVGENIQRSVI